MRKTDLGSIVNKQTHRLSSKGSLEGMHVTPLLTIYEKVRAEVAWSNGHSYHLAKFPDGYLSAWWAD